jgi:molybdate transport system ATP-binding protein
VSRGNALEAEVMMRRGGFLVRATVEAAAGETLALLGPNGAGKSTVVEGLAGLTPIEAGRVELDGRVLDARSEDGTPTEHVPPQERAVGVVFQDRLLFPHLSALENVAFPLRARGAPKNEARRRAGAELERLGVGHRAHAKPGHLSGGEAQRVALARALITEPRLLLLDEPLSALDVRTRAEVRTLVRSTLASFGGVAVLVTHDPVEAMTLADRMVLLEDGRVTQVGTPDQIREAPRTSYAAELVGVNLFTGRLERMEDGAGRILVDGGGEVIVGWPDDLPDARGVAGVLGLLRPAEVSLHVSRPEGGSARNLIEGRVAAVTLEGERARIRVAGNPPLVAEVTLGSVTRLRLAEGAPVWASFKAVEVRVVLP